MKDSKRPSRLPSRMPRRRTGESQAMPAVRQAVEAVRSELTQTPATGTDMRMGRVRREAMRILRDAETDEPNARQKIIYRAIRELFELVLGRDPE